MLGVLALALVAASPATLDADLLAAAERAFADGAELRHDSAKARPTFARAAAVYDELWGRGHHNPDLALNRANAHRLAGNLPAAVVALNEGLAAAPQSRALQVALEDARSAVGYPLVGDLAGQCRPAPAGTIGTRMSSAEAWAIGGALWLLACAAVARFGMTRRPVWLVSAAACTVGLAVLGAAWWRDHDRRRENEFPLVVLADDAVLRAGNAASYPPRMEAKLPRGVEARELARRGGWVQVRLAGGAIGWVPEGVLLRTGNRSRV